MKNFFATEVHRDISTPLPSFWRKPESSLEKYADNLCYFTILHDDAALPYLIERVGENKVAPGSDYPFPLRDPDPVKNINQHKYLQNYAAGVICWDTSAQLLGLKQC